MSLSNSSDAIWNGIARRSTSRIWSMPSFSRAGVESTTVFTSA